MWKTFHWDNEIYKVIYVHNDLAIFQVRSRKGDGKTKTEHYNMLLLCNQYLWKRLPVRNLFRSNHYNTINNIVQPEPEAETVNSSTGDNTDSSGEILIEGPQWVRKPPKLLTHNQLGSLNTGTAIM